MIRPNSEQLKTLPEQYFNVPDGETGNPTALYIVLERMELVIDKILDSDDVSSEAYFLQGLIYQAKSITTHLEGIE
ncbi:MAG: hypothetical protein KZQ83_12990 [gamma proteobacterium symbiont of Taylorina sp.]|nr:hypothetical protein [gamma proteobacterium symbiont of Taylorina sp.]